MMGRMSDAPKTVPTDVDARAFLAEVTPARRRRDAETVLGLMERVTGQPPVMWGPSIVGFGTTTLRYADGRTADWPAAAFSPRKAATTIYLGRRVRGGPRRRPRPARTAHDEHGLPVPHGRRCRGPRRAGAHPASLLGAGDRPGGVIPEPRTPRPLRPAPHAAPRTPPRTPRPPRRDRCIYSRSVVLRTDLESDTPISAQVGAWGWAWGGGGRERGVGQAVTRERRTYWRMPPLR